MIFNKHNIQKFIFSLFVAALLFFESSIHAQSKSVQINLLNFETNEPIPYAHFSIGSKKGISNENGEIRFNTIPETSLQISHVQYGQIKIEYNELTEIIKNGELKLQELELTISPTIIMGLHSDKYPDQQQELNYQDLLSHDAGAFLEQTPAISSIKKSSSYGFDPVFRGFKYDQINIIVDEGQTATAACPNRMDPPASQISLNMMDRVEVLKGPHSLRFGNAFGGTIHFISPEAEYTNNISPFGRVSGSYETNGSIKRTEAMLGARHNWYNFKLFGSHSIGDNYKDGNNEEIPSNFLRNSFGGTLDFKLTEKQELSVSATQNIAKDVDFPSLPMDLRNDNTTLFNLKHKVAFKKTGISSLKTGLFGSYVDHEMDNLSKALPRIFDAITTATTKTYGGRSELLSNLKFGELFTGIDVKITEQDGQRDRTFIMGPNSGNTVVDNVWQEGIMQQFGVFSEYHKRISKYNLMASLRVDMNNSEIRNPADEFLVANSKTSTDFANISASIGSGRNISGNTTIGLWFGRAERSGSLTELYINYFPVGLDAYEMVGNPNLKSEINNQLDFNFKWQTINSIIDINLFGSYLNNYISSEIREDLSPRMPMSPGVRQYINIDKAFMTGFEASWKQNIAWKINHQLGIAYTFAEDLNSNKPLPEIPPLEIGYKLTGNYFKDNFKPEVSFRYVLEQNRISEDFGETPSSSFTTVDIKLSYQIKEYLIISTGATNLFNEAYYEHLNRAMKIENGKALFARGRGGFITAAVKF